MNSPTRPTMNGAALALGIMLTPATALAQQLCAPMSHVLRQEGQLLYVLGDSAVPVRIGPDSYNDRLTILQACKSVTDTNWAVVEQQYGYNDALGKMTNALASTIHLLQQARQSQEGMDRLRNRFAVVADDYGGFGRILNCTLGKAIELAGNSAPSASDPNAAHAESHTIVHVDDVPPEMKAEVDRMLKEARAMCPGCSIPDPPWKVKADTPEAASKAKPKPTAPATRWPVIRMRAVLGTGCVTARFEGFGGQNAEGDWILTNGCPRDQIVAVEVEGATLLSWPAVVNTGSRPGAMSFDPGPLPFQAERAYEGARWLVPASGEIRHRLPKQMVPSQFDPGVDAWVVSCDDRTADGRYQVIFRPTSRLKQVPQSVCLPTPR